MSHVTISSNQTTLCQQKLAESAKSPGYDSALASDCVPSGAVSCRREVAVPKARFAAAFRRAAADDS